MRTRFDRRAPVLGALILVGSVAPLSAQVPNASAAATGLAGAYTARARNYDAIAWNPANLGLNGNSDFSFSALALSGSSGLTPVTLADVAPFSGKALPLTTRNAWLQTITANGGESGRFDGGVTLFAIGGGPVAFSVSGSVAGSTQLAPDAFELLMFGNAGRTGAPASLSLNGSTVHMGAFTTAAASYGLGAGGFAIGVTGKYIVGNAMTIAQDQGTTSSSSGLTVNFPAVLAWPDSGGSYIAGTGMGLDAGLAWSHKRFTIGAAVQNIMNTFAWDSTKLRARSAMAIFNETTDTTDFADRPYATAPAALRTLVANDKFKPIITGGIALGLTDALTFSADVRQRADDGIVIGPKTQVAGGLELRVSHMALRGGGAYVTDGWAASGGVSFSFSQMDMGVGAMVRRVNGVFEPGVTLNILSFR